MPFRQKTFFFFIVFSLIGGQMPGVFAETSFNAVPSELKPKYPLEDNRSSKSRASADSAGEYRIGPNDVLDISVYGEEDLTKQFRVTGTGYLTFPLLGRLKVAGMSVEDLEDYIRNALAKDYVRDPQVNVFMQEFSNIYVFGEVKEPGPYLFKGGMTVLQALTTAGSFTKIANKKNVRIVRAHGGERETIEVNAADIAKGAAEDTVLKPGDTIVVSESFF